MKYKWTTFTICSLAVAGLVSGCLTHKPATSKQYILPPNPIKLQHTMELARKKPFKNPLLFQGSNPRKALPKTFATISPPDFDLVLEWGTPTNAIGLPVVYQILCATNYTMTNAVVIGQTQGHGFIDRFNPAMPQKFYSIQTLASVNPNQVTFAWDPSGDPTISGYNVYYGNGPSNYTNSVDNGSSTVCVISNLTTGTYYAAVTSYTTNGLESKTSAEVTVTVTAVPPMTAPGLVAHR